jgi:ABC-type transport system substrate-binding protein
MLSRVLKSNVWLLMAISAIALVAAVACAEEAQEPAAPLPAKAAAEPAAPQAPAGAPGARQAAAAADTPLPAQAAAEPEAPKAAAGAVSVVVPKKITRTAPAGAGLDLQDPQELRTSLSYSGTPIWRGGGGHVLPWVGGLVYKFDRNGVLLPYMATSHTVNADFTKWTVRLRDDLVYHDGTPVTAADIKAYWEYGAKPENIVAWGGASLALADIKGWDELRAGDVTEAEFLVAIDDTTLEITTASNPSFPWLMAFSHTGVTKLSQIVSGDDEWMYHPIGIGPYQMTTDPDTNRFVLESFDVAGTSWWGDAPIIKKVIGNAVRDPNVQMIMFENEEIDLLRIPTPVFAEAQAPSHPLNKLLHTSPVAGLWYIKIKSDLAPLDDLLVRKALGHAVDMPTIAEVLWGHAASAYATGLISPLIPCFNPDGVGIPYDPELARSELASSSYGGPDLPPLIFDVSYPPMVNMAVATKEYWKDNLGVELDLLKRERGMPRRPGAQFYRISTASYVPDPIQIVSDLTRTDSIEALSNIPGGYPVMDALVKHARSLAVDDPNRCAAFTAIEEEYFDKVYMIPIVRDIAQTYVIHPWLIGFSSTLNQDYETLPSMYLLKH